MRAPLTIGLLGIGGDATAELVREIRRRAGGVRLIVDDDPGASALRLAEMAQGLEQAGAGIVALASDAAHAFQFEIERRIGVPFISMIEETGAAAAALAAGGKVGLQAHEASVGLYRAELARRGLGCLSWEASDAEILVLAGEPPSARGAPRVPAIRPVEALAVALADYALGVRPPPAPFAWTEVGDA